MVPVRAARLGPVGAGVVMTAVIDIPAGKWRTEISARLKAGATFCGLYAADDGRVRCALTTAPGGASGASIAAVGRAAGDAVGTVVDDAVLDAPAGTVVLVCVPTGSGAAVPSIIDLVPAANWDEREAHDMFGIDFDGHAPMRPLVNHGRGWRVPVTGGGAHEIAVGPIHAGIIESGHFRIHAVGDLMLLVDLRLFYKHRGLEQAAQGVALRDGIRFAQRACAGCAVSNSVAYALAVEELLGAGGGGGAGAAGAAHADAGTPAGGGAGSAISARPGVARVRTVLLELERLWNHLNDLSAICAGVGFAAGTMAFAALKEQAQRLNQRVFGHRFLFDTVAVGSSPVELTAAGARDIDTTVTAIAADLRIAWRALSFNGSVQERLRGTGLLGHKAARLGGAVGPVARAAAVVVDARTHAPRLCYPAFKPVVAGQPTGDVAARTTQRHGELLQTFELLRSLVGDVSAPQGSAAPSGPVEIPATTGIDAVSGRFSRGRVAVGRVESPRGETVCFVESIDGRSISRLHLRTGSFANWPLVGDAAAGNLVGEFPLINKSFELCYACVDR